MLRARKYVPGILPVGSRKYAFAGPGFIGFRGLRFRVWGLGFRGLRFRFVYIIIGQCVVPKNARFRFKSSTPKPKTTTPKPTTLCTLSACKSYILNPVTREKQRSMFSYTIYLCLALGPTYIAYVHGPLGLR